MLLHPIERKFLVLRIIFITRTILKKNVLKFNYHQRSRYIFLSFSGKISSNFLIIVRNFLKLY